MVNITRKFRQAIHKITHHVPEQELVEIAALSELFYKGHPNAFQKYVNQIRSQGYEVIQGPSTKANKPLVFIDENNADKFKYALNEPVTEWQEFVVYKRGNISEQVKYQHEFIERASDSKDKQDRYASIGLWYKRNNKDKTNTWSDTYSELVIEYLSNDADIMNAYRNWKHMDMLTRKQFVKETVEKVENLILAEPLPVALGPVVSGAGAAYYSNHQLTTDKKPRKHDTYFFSLDKHVDFKEIIENIIHECKHYAQDIGMSDIPISILKSNVSDYYTNTGKTDMNYNLQPIESDVRYLSRQAATEIIRRLQEQSNKSTRTDKTSDAEFLAHLKRMQIQDI